MKLNATKCFAMEVNFSRNPTVLPAIRVDGLELQSVNTIKLLGIMIQSDLKWESNVTDIIKRANGKLHMLRILKRHCLPVRDLLTIYDGYVRPILEYGTPVWNSGITKKQCESLTKIQKRALRIIVGARYTTYQNVLTCFDMETLEQRRHSLCTSFIGKSISRNQLKNILPQITQKRVLRHTKKLPELRCRTNRVKNSPIPSLVRIYNSS